MDLHLLQNISSNLYQQIQILSTIFLRFVQHHLIQRCLDDEADVTQQSLSMLCLEYLRLQLQDEFSVNLNSNSI